MTPVPSTPLPDAPPSSAEAADRTSIIRWIVVAIMIWGVVHAVGAWSFNWNPLRPLVVLACVGAFLGFWMTMLAVRQRRLNQRR
jgi:nitrate reductase NapE component